MRLRAVFRISTQPLPSRRLGSPNVLRDRLSCAILCNREIVDRLQVHPENSPWMISPMRVIQDRILGGKKGLKKINGEPLFARVQPGIHMKRNVVLTIMSLLSILLLSLHLTDDIVYGSDKSAVLNVVAAAVLLIWLYGTVVLAERRSGYAIMLLGAVVGMVVFTVHVSRPGGLSAGRLAESSGAFFFVWTLLALAVSSAFSAIISVHGLWNLRRSNAPSTAFD